MNIDIQQVVNHEDQTILQCCATQINMSEFPSIFESPMTLVESLLVIRLIFILLLVIAMFLTGCLEFHFHIYTGKPF